jgi:hypothetical protein
MNMSPERPKPDLDHTREMLRKHDRRVESEDEEEQAAEPDEGEDKEPDSAA